MYFTTLLTALFATGAMGIALPNLEVQAAATCGIVNSTLTTGENVQRLSMPLPGTNTCTAVQGVPFYYRVDSGCSCNFFT
jgi:hypothetical protein